MLLYGAGRAVLWLVVVASCWSMAACVHRFLPDSSGWPDRTGNVKESA
jgi:hypothetical protein